MLAALFSGRPIAPFTQIDEKRWVLNVPQPSVITDMCLTMTVPLFDAQFAAVCYYAVAPFTEWAYVGYVSLDNPTTFVYPPWRNQISADTEGIQLGISIEPVDVVKNLKTENELRDDVTFNSAQAIANHLYTFMASFSQNTGKYANLGDVLVIPTNCIDRWFEKFSAKHRLTPYFWMKKQQ